MKLVDVNNSPTAPKLLYRLLEERTPDVNISHRGLPDWESHIAFINSRPYDAWYQIEENGEPVGAIYLTATSEIGVFILKAHRGKGYGRQAIEMLMATHPRKRFLANINPTNQRSIEFFQTLGFQHIQNTYEKR